MDLSPAAIASPPPAHDDPTSPVSSRTRLLVYGYVAILSAALMAYALTRAFVWDEGFHFIAAQLILRGKLPYIDFCFPQPPLNAYWNAAWMRVFGEHWRVPHIPAALEISGAMFLTAQFLLNRFPAPRWRAAAAILAATFIGTQLVIVQFGPIAQAYAAGMFLCVAAFRVAVAWPGRPRSSLLGFGTGLFAGAAAACTLLTGPVGLVLFIWFWVQSNGLQRLKNLSAYIVGALIPYIPVFWLFAKSPRVVFFNIVQYQAIYRRAKWNGATAHDVDVLTSWMVDGQTLLLGLLAALGIYFVMKKSGWPSLNRVQFYLAGWIALGLILYISTAHPTFGRYFVFATPFLSLLASAGLYWVAFRLTDSERSVVPTAILITLLLLGCGRGLFADRDATTWKDYEKIAKKVKEVTPKNGVVYCDELVYFLLKLTPPTGMEFSYSRNMELSPAEEKLYHVVSQKEMDAQVKAGRFDTVQACNDDKIEEMHLSEIFAQKEDIDDCSIFWDKISSKLSKPGK